MKSQTQIYSESTTVTIVKKSAAVFLFATLGTPLGYLMRMIFSRTLSIEMFGLFFAVLGFIEIFVPFQDFGTGFSLTYFTPKLLKLHDNRSVWLMFVYSMLFRFLLTLIISLAVVLNANWLASNYFKIDIAEQLLYLFASYLVINSVTNGFNHLFVGFQKEKYYASAEPLRLLLVVLLSGVVWFWNRSDVINYAVIWNIVYLCLVMYYCWLLLSKHRGFFSSISWQKSIFEKLFKFSLPLFSGSIIYILTNQIGLVYLTYFRTVTEIGIYNVILPIAGITTMFITPLQNVFLPMVSEFMQEDKNKVRLLLENILKILPFVIIYFNFFIFLFPQFTLGLLFSNKWLESATIPLMVISLGYIFQTISGFLSIVADGMGLVKERMKLHFVGAISSVVLGLFLIYYLGLIGLIIINSLTFIMITVGVGRIIYQRIKFDLPILFYSKYMVLLVGMFTTVKILRISPSSWQIYILVGLLYTAVSALFALWQGLLEKDKLQLILDGFKLPFKWRQSSS